MSSELIPCIYAIFPDNSIRAKGFIQDCTFITHTSEYRRTGSFKIKAILSNDNLELCKENRIVLFDETTQGIIEYVSKDSEINEITISGRLISAILDRRGIKDTTKYVDAVIPQIIYTEFNKVQSGNSLPVNISFSIPIIQNKISYEVKRTSFLDFIENICDQFELGYSMKFNETKTGFDLLIYGSNDHTEDSERPVILSPEYDNVQSGAKFEVNDQGVYNCAYVVAKKPEDNLTVWASGTPLSGLNCRLLVVDASSVNQGDATYEQYMAMLETEGRKALVEHSGERSYSATISNGLYEYKRDFSLGDLVTVKDESIKESVDCRIAQAIVSYDSTGETIRFVLGEPQKTLLSVLSDMKKKVAERREIIAGIGLDLGHGNECFNDYSNNTIGSTSAGSTTEYNHVEGSNNSITDARYNTVGGYNNKSSGDYNVVFGSYNEVKNNGNIVCGSYNKTLSSSNAAVFGANLINGSQNSLTIGQYNSSGNNYVICAGGGSSSKRENVFTVNRDGEMILSGYPQGSYERENTFVLDKEGNLTIKGKLTASGGSAGGSITIREVKVDPSQGGEDRKTYTYFQTKTTTSISNAFFMNMFITLNSSYGSGYMTVNMLITNRLHRLYVPLLNGNIAEIQVQADTTNDSISVVVSDFHTTGYSSAYNIQLGSIYVAESQSEDESNAKQ